MFGGYILIKAQVSTFRVIFIDPSIISDLKTFWSKQSCLAITHFFSS